MSSLQVPFPIFTDTDGKPLDGGSIYIGTALANPETSPVVVYDEQAQPIAQPIRTLNGYPVVNGRPVTVDTPTTYSITVRNKKGAIVYSVKNASADGTASDEDVITLRGIPLRDRIKDDLQAADLGLVGDGSTDNFAAMATALEYAAGKPISLEPGLVYGTLYPLDIHSLSEAARSGGGFTCRRRHNRMKASFTASAGQTDFVVGFELYIVDVLVNGVVKLYDSVPVLTTSIVNNFLQRNDYNLYRRNKMIRFNTPMAGGETVEIRSRWPGAIIRSIGDWSPRASSAQRNRLIGFADTLSETPRVDGFLMQNVTIDGNGQAVSLVRAQSSNPKFENVLLIGAQNGYGWQSKLVGGSMRGMHLIHVMPAQADELEAGVVTGEDCWFPANETLVAGGKTVKTNNGMDFNAADAVVEDVFVDMRGNATQSGFWQNNASAATYTNVSTLDGASGIGMESSDSLRYIGPKCRQSGAAKASTTWNNRMLVDTCTNVDIRDPDIKGSGANGINYASGCTGMISGGAIAMTGASDYGIAVHGSNKMMIAGVDTTGSTKQIKSTTGTFGDGIRISGCPGVQDRLTDYLQDRAAIAAQTINAGAGLTTNVSLMGALLATSPTVGPLMHSYDKDLQGLFAGAHCDANGSANYRLYNRSGADVALAAGTVNIRSVSLKYLKNRVTDLWNPAAIADGAQLGRTTAFPGAQFGDFIMASVTTNGMLLFMGASVSAVDTVRTILLNHTGASVDLPSSSLTLYQLRPEVADYQLVSAFAAITSMATGTVQSFPITMRGVSLGDFVHVSLSIALQDLFIRAEVTAADTVTVYVYNNTGAPVTTAACNLRLLVFKK